MLGRSYEENLPDGSKKSFSLKYIDWENECNNDFHVVEEFTVEREDGRGNIRPDIVLFVNGIPLCVIECKKSSIDARYRTNAAKSGRIMHPIYLNIARFYGYQQK